MPELDPHNLRQYKNVTVMGIGRFGGGAGVVRYFAGLGANVVATDLAPAEKLAQSIEGLEAPNVRFVLGEHRPEDFVRADLVVANQAARPDHPLLLEARAAGVPVVTETGLALALARSPWVGVTGSSGKSTTAALTAAILAESDPGVMFGGNIGGDLLTRVTDHPADSPIVVELSSFQLIHVRDDFAAGRVRPPRVAVITNLAPNHLDWHRDLDEYLAAKRALLTRQGPDDWAILNADDYRLAAWAVTAPARVVHCALDDPGFADACYEHAGAVNLRLAGELVLRCPLDRFRLPGRHNLHNAVMAAAAGFVTHRNPLAVQSALGKFAGLPHRLRTVAGVGGRTFVDDSKSTTPEAAVTALASFDRPTTLIAGGYDKFAPFEEMAAAIQRRAAGLVLVGQAAARLGSAVREAAGRRPAGMEALAIVEAGDDFASAVREAFRLTPEGGVVLLSPGCASYGMFVNYEERGAVFAELAGKLAREENGSDEEE